MCANPRFTKATIPDNMFLHLVEIRLLSDSGIRRHPFGLTLALLNAVVPAFRGAGSANSNHVGFLSELSA
jgi:hypothetical protein